jgi:oligosaccharide repeat unit polymerase
LKLIINPSLFFNIWLCIIVFFSTILYNFEITNNLILFFIIVFSSSFLGYIFSLRFVNNIKKKISFQINSYTFSKFFKVSLFFWILCQIIIMSPGLKLFDFSDPEMTKNLATQYFLDNEGLDFNESGKGILTIFNTLFYILGFPALIFGSYFFSKKKYIGIIPFLFGCLTSLVTFSRFHMFIYLVIFIYSYFVFRILDENKINFKKSLLKFFTISLILFGVPAILRSGENSDINLLSILNIYVFGGFAAFSLWFNNNFIIIGNLNGTSFYSLKTWLSYAGLAKPPSNLHYEFINIDNNNFTNVYSLFRPLIEDFGLFFLFLIIFIFSFISNKLYYKVIIEKKIYFLPLLSFLFTFCAFMFYTSIFSDFRILLGCTFSSIVLKYCIIKKLNT